MTGQRPACAAQPDSEDRAHALDACEKMAEFVGGLVSQDPKTGKHEVIIPYTRGALDAIAKGERVSRGPPTAAEAGRAWRHADPLDDIGPQET